MAKIKEACSCGAYVEYENAPSGLVAYRVEEFRKAHELCLMQKLTLAPEDILVLKHPGQLSSAAYDRLLSQWKIILNE